jgi:hypothetical protein
VVADGPYEFYHKQKEDGKLSSPVPDACIQKTAASKGWVAHANYLLHHDVTTSQYLEFKIQFGQLSSNMVVQRGPKNMLA